VSRTARPLSAKQPRKFPSFPLIHHVGQGSSYGDVPVCFLSLERSIKQGIKQQHIKTAGHPALASLRTKSTERSLMNTIGLVVVDFLELQQDDAHCLRRELRLGQGVSLALPTNFPVPAVKISVPDTCSLFTNLCLLLRQTYFLNEVYQNHKCTYIRQYVPAARRNTQRVILICRRASTAHTIIILSFCLLLLASPLSM